MKVRFIKYLLLIFFIFSLQNKIILGNTEKRIQELHQQISNDLLEIRKNNPQLQIEVYSVIDQVCNLYKISKKLHSRKTELKSQLKTRTQEAITLKAENILLKNQIQELQNKLHSSKQEINNNQKKLQKNNMLVSFLTKEKQKLLEKIQKLKEEKKELTSKNSKQDNQNKNLKKAFLSNELINPNRDKNDNYQANEFEFLKKEQINNLAEINKQEYVQN